jgi:hypothetical protein
VSKSTILASGQITPSPHHTITVELVDPDGVPATVRIGWPPQPTVINPRRFPELAARVARIFADFTESARVVRARATKYAERMYVSDRFLNRAAALEGFDRIRTRKGRVATMPTELGSVSISPRLSLGRLYTIQLNGPLS